MTVWRLKKNLAVSCDKRVLSIISKCHSRAARARPLLWRKGAAGGFLARTQRVAGADSCTRLLVQGRPSHGSLAVEQGASCLAGQRARARLAAAAASGGAERLTQGTLQPEAPHRRSRAASAHTSARGANARSAGGRASARTSAARADARSAEGRASAHTSARGANARSAVGQASASTSARGAIARSAGGRASASTSAGGANARSAGGRASASTSARGANARSAGRTRTSRCRRVWRRSQRNQGRSVTRQEARKCNEAGGTNLPGQIKAQSAWPNDSEDGGKNTLQSPKVPSLVPTSYLHEQSPVGPKQSQHQQSH